MKLKFKITAAAVIAGDHGPLGGGAGVLAEEELALGEGSDGSEG